MTAGIIKFAMYCSVLVAPLALIVWSASAKGHGALEETGKAFALIGFMIIVLQPVLAGRFKWITRSYGLDMVMRYHRGIALLGGVLIVLHPLLLAAGKQDWQLLIGLDLPWYIWVGKASMLLLIIHLLVSVYQERIGLKFERWRLSHAVIAPALLAGAFVHSMSAGDDFAITSLVIFWCVIAAAALAAFVYHKAIRPKLLRRRPWTVRAVTKEADRVWTINFSPPSASAVCDYLPGQFHFITLHRKHSLPEEEHHWTISSSPQTGTGIASTIKESGDFTETIGRTSPGDTATIQGAFGRFSYLLHPREGGIVCIAGGIGITPVMSMIRHMRDSSFSGSVLLLYANRTEADIVFRQELDEIAAGPLTIAIEHVLSKPGPDWNGRRGHINRTLLKERCGAELLQKAEFYVCGPAGLRESIIRDLRSLGVSEKRIHMELFTFI